MVVIRELKPHETLEGLGLIGDTEICNKTSSVSSMKRQPTANDEASSTTSRSSDATTASPSSISPQKPPSYRPKTAPSCRAVKELRREQLRPPPSRLKEAVVAEALAYIASHVDPVIYRLMTELVVHKPANVSLAMLNYFKWRQSGEAEASDKVEKKVLENWNRAAEKTDRLYASHNVTPVVSELMRQLAMHQPSDLDAYVISYLSERIKQQEEEQKQKRAREEQQPQAQTSSISPPSSSPRSPTKTSSHNRRRSPPRMTTHDGMYPPPSGKRPSSVSWSAPTGAGDLYDSLSTSLSSSISSSASAAAIRAAAAPVPAPTLAKTLKSINVVVLGLNGAGKSTLLAALQGDVDPQVMATTGFRPVQMALAGGTRVRFYDLGGGPKIRGIWSSYYHDVHAVVWVVDAADQGRWGEGLDLLHSSLAHKYLVGKPLLVLANKQDQSGALVPEEIRKGVTLSTLDNQEMIVQVTGCTAHGAKHNDGKQVDERVEQSFLWLFDRVCERGVALESRVKADSVEVEAEFEREKQAKDREVLKGLVAKAANGTQEDRFTKDEGLAFLAAEIGEAGTETLPSIAIALAEAVGYQKLALQMIGAMKCPISRRKVALSWESIAEMIDSINAELGLSSLLPKPS